MTADLPPALPADLRHLQAFVAAAETGSMSAAAARLHVSQQALSRTVATLEERVGARLFERMPRGLTLTATGEALLAPAERALDAAREAFAVVREAAGSRATAPLRADISSGGIETGALIIRRLRREHPGIPIELTEVGMARGSTCWARASSTSCSASPSLILPRSAARPSATNGCWSGPRPITPSPPAARLRCPLSPASRCCCRPSERPANGRRSSRTTCARRA